MRDWVQGRREWLPSRSIFGAHRLTPHFLVSPSALLSVLQDDAAATIVHNTPFFYLLDGPKTAQASQIIIETTVAHTGRLDGAVDVTHSDWIP
jgi:hypothetical protein